MHVSVNKNYLFAQKFVSPVPGICPYIAGLDQLQPGYSRTGLWIRDRQCTNREHCLPPGFPTGIYRFDDPNLSLLRKFNLTENRTLSEVEVSLLTGVCILRLHSGSN